LNPLAELRRLYSIGLGAVAVTLPLLAVSIDTIQAAPKAKPRTAATSEPLEDVNDPVNPETARADRQKKNVKLNYVAAAWSKVLQDFAEATQTELVATRVPSSRFSRWDLKFYTRDEALKILNQELQPLSYRLQFKGHYLVVNELNEFRNEYPDAVLRGEPRRAAENSVDGVTTAAAEIPEEPERRADQPRGEAAGQTKKASAPRNPARDSRVRQVSGQEETARSPVPAPPPQEPVQTTVRLKARDAVSVSKVIFRAFKSTAELVDDGPRGLQGFLVRRESGEGPKQAGQSNTRFAIGIDEKKNQLVIEATPNETKGILKFIKTLDVVLPNAESQVRAVPTTKDADKVAAALQPQINRLVSATRKASAQRTDADDQAADDAQDQQPAAPQRPGLRRGDLRGESSEAAQSAAPQGLVRSLKGEVKVESVPDLGILVITGNESDVQAVMSVIQEIERLSVGTAPEVQVAFLRHVNSEALAALLTSVYQRLGEVRNAQVQQTQAITVFPVSRPNAVLIVASKADMPAVFRLIDELDQPSDPTSEFRVFRLKNAVPGQIVTKVEALYPPVQAGQAANQQATIGLVPRVRIIDDLRTNSVVVQARPRDMREIAALIAELDVVDTDSVQEMRIFRLENAVAEEVSATLSQAIQNVLSPARATTVQQQGQPGGGQQGQQQGAAPGQGAAELREIKSAILKFRDRDGRELRSGILADIRMNPDFRTNSIIVTAPSESMDLIADLIKRLDIPPVNVAAIKIFRLLNSDATAMRTMLEGLFGIQRTGQPGQQGGAAGGAQAGVPGLLVADAEDSSSMLIPLRFTVDVRTNSITAIGGAAALDVVESVLLTLDDSSIRQRKNEVYRLKNVPAQNVATAVSQFLQTQQQVGLQVDPNLVSPFEQMEREVIVVAEPVTNNLLISATPRYFKDIKEMILQLDKVPRQVIIQALIVEVTLDNTDEFGMEFGLQDSILFRRSTIPAPVTVSTTTLTPGGTVSSNTIISESATPGFLFNGQQLGNNTFSGVNSSSVAGQASSIFGTALQNGALGFPGLLLQAGSENINFLLRALAYRSRVDILSRPQIRTVDNQTAQIQVGQEVRLVNGFTTQGTAGVNVPTVTPRQIGIILQVTPRITPDGLVVMQVIARKDTIAPGAGITLVTSPTGNITVPIINTINALTTIAVPTGQTVILGGMITKNDTIQERKVPVLGDVPILGNAFRYDLKTMNRTELLFFLTPRIIHDDETSEMIKQIEAERLTFMECEAERMHGPLYGIPPREPATSLPTSDTPDDSTDAYPESPKTRRTPKPPEPGIAPMMHSTREPSPVPAYDDDTASSIPVMPNDDDEDLDAAFIQTSYQAPAGARPDAGQIRVAKPGSKTPAATKGKKPTASNSKKPPDKSAKERQTNTRRPDSEE
jgi:type II secretion system protein D